MEPIKIKVTEADAIVTQAPTITSGMTGLMAEFEFDEAWEGFAKTAVFKAGDVVRDVVDIGASCKVPPEVLAQPYRVLRIGVYGVSADGEVVIPTVWAAVDEIRLGADPSGDESTEPTLPVWQQILNKVNGCVKTVNGTAPDKNGNVQVETGSGGVEIFRATVDYSELYPSEEEVLAAIRAGKIIEVHEYTEPNIEKISYGWTKESDDGECYIYHVGSYSFLADAGGAVGGNKIEFYTSSGNGYLNCSKADLQETYLKYGLIQLVTLSGEPSIYEISINEDSGFEVNVTGNGESYYYCDDDESALRENSLFFKG